MRKEISILFSLFWLAVTFEIQAQFSFATNNGAITITGYSGPGGAVVIPGTTNGLPVTSIGTNAFANVANLTSVAIPDNVTNIGDHAFTGCIGLTAVSFPAQITRIGISAFSDCNLFSIEVPNSVMELSDGVFSYCGNLANATLGTNIARIGAKAFMECSLTNLIIPNGVTSIGDYAFAGCSLIDVTIPSSATNVGIAPFYGPNLMMINVDPQNLFYSSVSGVLCNKSHTTLVEYPAGRIGSYAIPQGVTSIAAFAFSTCGGLTAITMSSSVSYVDNYAFSGCTALGSVYFGGNAPTVGTGEFNGDNATVYYLPGTTGWSQFLSNVGLPGVLWNPLIQTTDNGFGVRTNRFGFNITGTANIPIVVEGSTDLASGSWVPLLSGTLTNGSIYFSDPQWANYRSRFYRIRSP